MVVVLPVLFRLGGSARESVGNKKKRQWSKRICVGLMEQKVHMNKGIKRRRERNRRLKGSPI